jgi:solute carrier family 25 protein 34/35
MATTTGYAALSYVRNCALMINAHRSFIAGGIAACGAVTVTHGFETVKIRCAVQFLQSGWTGC